MKETAEQHLIRLGLMLLPCKSRSHCQCFGSGSTIVSRGAKKNTLRVHVPRTRLSEWVTPACSLRPQLALRKRLKETGTEGISRLHLKTPIAPSNHENEASQPSPAIPQPVYLALAATDCTITCYIQHH